MRTFAGNEMRRIESLLLILAAMAVMFPGFAEAQASEESSAKIWEQQIVLPTYLTGKDGPNPRFYNGRAYQGAQGRVYPYPIQERFTDNRQDVSYNAVYLENEYIQISLLPEIGGRLFSALDKTNNHDFIYRQHVIKPALIGMLGAWITGGIEWNVFHHHRNTSFMPVDHTIQENPDGSVTAWVGEIEMRHRMKWAVGVTVYPGKSYFVSTLVAYNRSPLIHSILYFANAGVHTGEDYQVIFPPSTEWVTQHAKREFAGWPIAHENYNRVDFTSLGLETGNDGVDITWWKNNLQQISYFCFNYEDDWMIGYDHGKDAGTCIVANHHIAPGKKFWTWGSGPKGKVWDTVLTDTDGPELELMAGGYSDNEPDYSWIKPYETKIVRHYWYPVRGMGKAKSANIEAAISLDVTDENSAKIGFNTTSRRDNAKVLLMAARNVIFEKEIDISPDKPFFREVALPAGVKEEDLRVSLLSSEGEELIAYKPVKRKGAPMPEVVKPPAPPKEIDSVEELYLAGMRLEQFYHPSLDPLPFYEEALKRDRGNSRVNTAVGIINLRNGKFDEAEKYLRIARDRVARDYTHPRDAEAFYYHGLALRYLERFKEAYDDFYQATWDAEFHSSAYYQLAEIDCRNGDFAKAIEHLARSLSTNPNNMKALNLNAIALRKMNRLEEAEKVASMAVSTDELNSLARNEFYLTQSALGLSDKAARTISTLTTRMRDIPNSYLELATDYGNCGLFNEAIEVLSRLIEMNKPGVSTYPMLYYYAGYYSQRNGDVSNAHNYYRLAEQMPPDYCFPCRLESIRVLRTAMNDNPEDAMAPYYLGNLLYENQPEAAIQAWEKSERLGADFAPLHRNLGLAYNRTEKDIPKAIASYRKAMACDNKDTRIIYELDVLYEKSQLPLEERLAFLQKHHETLISDSYLLPLEREIRLYVQLGQYDKALELMKPYHFHRWEGGGNVYASYVDANIRRGLQLLNAKEHQKALQYFEAALKYPLKMEASKSFAGGRSCEVHYLVGRVNEIMGDSNKARESYEQAVAERQYYHRSSIPHYYRGLALKKLGRTEEANQLFDGLIKLGEERLAAVGTSSGLSFFAKFGERDTAEARKARAHHFIGLGYSGKGEYARAKAEFEMAGQLDINLLLAVADTAGLEQ